MFKKLLSKKINQLTFSKVFLIVSFLTVVSSCSEEDFDRLRKKGNRGSGGGTQRDTTISKDSSFRDSTYKDTCYRDSTYKDTIRYNDSCVYREETYFHDIGIKNNLRFSKSDKVILNYTAIGMNLCSTEVSIKEERKVKGNVVEITLTPIVKYEGCICGQSLNALYGNYQIKRENSNSSMTYNITYKDRSLTNNTVSFTY